MRISSHFCFFTGAGLTTVSVVGLLTGFGGTVGFAWFLAAVEVVAAGFLAAGFEAVLSAGCGAAFVLDVADDFAGAAVAGLLAGAFLAVLAGEAAAGLILVCAGFFTVLVAMTTPVLGVDPLTLTAAKGGHLLANNILTVKGKGKGCEQV